MECWERKKLPFGTLIENGPFFPNAQKDRNPMRHPMVLANGALCAYLILDL